MNKSVFQGWGSALSAFTDRRSIIMLFLGFSAGIPIFLIFSTLSFWLTESGVNRATVTMFAWAALGYSFKFIWAPLIDQLPIPYLTKKLGQRRSWLLVAQFMVIAAICFMAMINPHPSADHFQSFSNLAMMACAATMLGFSSATQDIVIDAYRIELTQDPNLQTVLASTYNAGYRIATIIAQLGALLLATALGTTMGNYIYEAWQTTYFVMAALMLVGVLTTFIVNEPSVQRLNKGYRTQDYVQLVAVFLISTLVFIGTFVISSGLFANNVNDAALKFLLQFLRFGLGVICAVTAIVVLIKVGIVDKKIVVETWLRPILDFFQRYGLKVALAILLLIGFYRISDIVAGTIANVYYLDLNFSKDEIAWFNKLFAIIFVIIGGFIGGLMAQRYSIIKMMFVGAIIASTTNLIFVGLVKSGDEITPLAINIGTQNYEVQPDEVGRWSITLPRENLTHGGELKLSTQLANQNEPIQLAIPLYQLGDQPQLIVHAIGGDNQLYQDEIKNDVKLNGQLINIPQEEKIQSIQIIINSQKIDAKLNSAGVWSALISGEKLAKSKSFKIEAKIYSKNQIYTIEEDHTYNIYPTVAPAYRMYLDELPMISSTQSDVEVKGKVIVPYSRIWLVMGIILDNLASGLAGAVFIAFLSSLTSISFTAMQYAIFSSLMLLLPKVIGGYSGTIVTVSSYSTFFFITFLMGIPILFLVVWVGRLLKNHEST